MKMNHVLAATVIAASSLLAACGTTTSPSASQTSPATQVATSYGVVDSIQMVNTSSGSSGGIGAGTVVGGVVGGVLGNQVGSGRGRTAATAAGAVGGAVAGHEYDKQRQQSTGTMYQVGVRLDNGSYQTVMQDSVADLSVGNRVRIENGRAYRY
jgi:outer membrane lipoprotein SlyB